MYRLSMLSSYVIHPCTILFYFKFIFLFFFNDTATTEIYTLSLHDALPISSRKWKSTRLNSSHDQISYAVFCLRSEEHTSELQSRSDLVCRLLLEKERAHV